MKRLTTLAVIALLLALGTAQAQDAPGPLPPTGILLHSGGCLMYDIHWDYEANEVWDLIWSLDPVPSDKDHAIVTQSNHWKQLFYIPAMPPNRKYYIYVRACWYQHMSECSAWAYAGFAVPMWTQCFNVGTEEPVWLEPLDPTADPTMTPETAIAPYAVKAPHEEALDSGGVVPRPPH